MYIYILDVSICIFCDTTHRDPTHFDYICDPTHLDDAAQNIFFLRKNNIQTCDRARHAFLANATHSTEYRRGWCHPA